MSQPGDRIPSQPVDKLDAMLKGAADKPVNVAIQRDF